jgi:glutamate racemase
MAARPISHAEKGQMPDLRPIGLFDSGVGGLTILKKLATLLPHENFVYLGDTARLPYGSKSPETIVKYLEQNLDFLERHQVKSAVVACNSASTVVVDQRIKARAFPVFDVILPGSEAAVRASESGRIGIIGTRATVRADSYQRAILKLNPMAKVFSMACPLLVPLVEEGWEDDPLTNLVIYRYISPLLKENIDTLVLGCTHYPALKTSIAKVVGPHVQLIDSSQSIAEILLREGESMIEPTPRPPSAAKSELDLTPQKISISITDKSEAFVEVARRLLYPLIVSSFEQVDL